MCVRVCEYVTSYRRLIGVCLFMPLSVSSFLFVCLLLRKPTQGNNRLLLLCNMFKEHKHTRTLIRMYRHLHTYRLEYTLYQFHANIRSRHFSTDGSTVKGLFCTTFKCNKHFSHVTRSQGLETLIIISLLFFAGLQYHFPVRELLRRKTLDYTRQQHIE